MDEYFLSDDPPNAVLDNLVGELASDLLMSLHIAYGDELENTSDGEEKELSDCGGCKIASHQKHLSRYESFPPAGKPTSPLSSDKDDEESESESQEQFLNEHALLKLVSAMKGSREKQGATLRKLRVTWAPDVYDPIPTSVSHAPRRSTRQHKASRKDKRHGKKGHKGKDSPRGSSSSDGKDKRKKKRKHLSAQAPMSSNTCYKSMDTGNGIVNLKPDQVEKYGMGILDTSCGDSFLKMSMVKAHYPLAEAL
ncbi:hypothetical protein SAY87_008953 [Trapa incisa]|uniref:Uncharacterized protein n=1 Tax=Trapa incisa TaxID=236973 RepID=A0AAN7JVW2_9MYRT|nr:hypothetical protein SAY87_008953 [Trapa incisa]